MEPWWTVGGGSRPASRIPCRNFARGACRWGQNCRFSHDRKTTQICKYFQNGYCGYGDRCSYQHILEAPVLSRCGSESARPALLGSMLLLNRRGSEPVISPEASVRSWGGARRDSEPAFSGMTQLQTNFGSMSMSLDEGDEDAEKTTSSLHPRIGLSVKNLSPGRQLQEQKTDATPLMPESASIKEAAPASLVSEEPKAAGGSGAAAAAAGATAAVTQSEDVVCGICMDKVSQKALPEERLFGILPNCTHAYCVGCIRKWRKSRDFHSTVIKGCPECRVTSTYFIPNKYWVFESEEKEKLIETFKARTSKIRCKFFVRGNGHCPFKSECIYLHELPRGQLPTSRSRQRPDRRRRQPIAYNLSPSDSSDDDDDDMYLVHWALTFALLQSDRDFDFSDFLWDSSDSSD